MNWELDALKILAKNPTVPGIALRDAIGEIERLTKQVAELQGSNKTGKNTGLQLMTHIAELEAERDKLQEQGRWIPITDGIPDEGQFVLVLYGEQEYSIGSWRFEDDGAEVFQNEYKQWEVWSFGANKFEDIDEPPTQWMPLPEVVK